MLKCQTPCIYYYESHTKSESPTVRLICDFRDGEEIKNLSINEINECKHFKTYNQVKKEYKNL